MGLGLTLIVLGGLATLVGWIWLIVVAFREKLTAWGVILILGFFLPFGPIAALVFAFVHPGQARTPRNLLLAGLGLGLLGGVFFYQGARGAIESSPEMVQLREQMSRAGTQETAEVETPPPVPATLPAPPPPKPAAAAVPPKAPPTPAPRTETESAPAPAPPVDIAAPVRIEVLSLGAPAPNQMRPLFLRISNTATQAVMEVKLDLTYLDAAGRRLGGRSTIYSGTGPLAGPLATNEFQMTAFRVPEFTTRMRVVLEAAVFADRSRWPVSP